MIDWQDRGTLLASRPHGETSAIVEVFTAAHGRHAGVVRGGISRRIAPVLQPGNRVAVRWTARIDDHIGAFTVEPEQSRMPQIMGDRTALAGSGAVCALCAFVLPEREPMPALHADTEALFDMIGVNPLWPFAYLRWELALLDALGFGLDLSRCAATGVEDDLAFVSPRSGRAVSRAAGARWADRLLPLPDALRGQGGGDPDAVREGLRTTGHFLAHRVAPALGGRALPPARARLIAALSPRRDQDPPASPPA